MNAQRDLHVVPPYIIYILIKGVGFLMKRMASAMKPTMVIEVQGDEVVVTRKTPIKDLHSRHKLGEETDIVEHDRKYKVTSNTQNLGQG